MALNKTSSVSTATHSPANSTAKPRYRRHANRTWKTGHFRQFRDTYGLTPEEMLPKGFPSTNPLGSEAIRLLYRLSIHIPELPGLRSLVEGAVLERMAEHKHEIQEVQLYDLRICLHRTAKICRDKRAAERKGWTGPLSDGRTQKFIMTSVAEVLATPFNKSIANVSEQEVALLLEERKEEEPGDLGTVDVEGEDKGGDESEGELRSIPEFGRQRSSMIRWPGVYLRWSQEVLRRKRS